MQSAGIIFIRIIKLTEGTLLSSAFSPKYTGIDKKKKKKKKVSIRNYLGSGVGDGGN